MRHRILYWMLLLGVVCTAQAQTSDNYRSLLRNPHVEIDKTRLPIVFLDVAGQMIGRESPTLAHMKIIYAGKDAYTYGDTLAHPGQKVDYEGYIALKYRGNSSFNSSEKKPYSVKTLSAADLESKKAKVSLLGMAKDKDWVLLAPFADKSMMRDIMTYDLARPYFDWTPHGQFCEVVLDGTYYGIFVLLEKAGTGKSRLNLTTPGDDAGDLSGGYYVQIDRDDDPNYKSKHHPLNKIGGTEEIGHVIKYQYKDPEEEDFATLPAGTREALHAEIDKMEASFLSPDYKDAENGYRKYIDVQSFIDYMLVTELSMNIDGYRLSTDMYKHSATQAAAKGLDSRWKLGLWDFNIAYGNANYFGGESTSLWQYNFNSREPGDAEHVPFYWYKMLQDDAYVAQMKARWAEYRKGSYTNERIEAYIDSVGTLLTSSGAIDRNQQAYEIIGRQVWPNAYVGQTYDDEIAYLKRWLTARMKFMDRQFLPKEATQIVTEPVAIADGLNADVIAEDRGTVYYTTGIDGSMPYYSVAVQEAGGLPADGQLTTTTDDEVTFTLAPYNQQNALHLAGNGSTGTLSFDKPFLADGFFFLATSGNGTSTVKVEVTYADGTMEKAQTFDVKDWSQRNPDGTEAITGLGRMVGQTPSEAANCHFVMTYFDVACDKAKAVKSITFTSQSNAMPNIFAISRVVSKEMLGIGSTPSAGPQAIDAIYTASGVRLNSLQKGLNIVKYSDGTTRKIVVR